MVVKLAVALFVFPPLTVAQSTVAVTVLPDPCCKTFAQPALAETVLYIPTTLVMTSKHPTTTIIRPRIPHLAYLIHTPRGVHHSSTAMMSDGSHAPRTSVQEEQRSDWAAVILMP